MNRLLTMILSLCLVVGLSACGGGAVGGVPGGPPGAPGGATPGGAQDTGTARELIKNGVVPPAEAFTVEGAFSEHDLPLEGAACERILCLRGALGLAPTLAGAASGWLQVGLSSAIDLSTFERPDLSLVFVVDISGSMSWQYDAPNGKTQTPLSVAQIMMEKLIPTLREGDEVALVVYGDEARTVLSFTPGSQQDKLLSSVRELASEGATNMEAGLQTAYRLMAAQGGANRERRLLLFTDVQPNVGASAPSEFEALVAEGAASGVGLSVFGVGVGLGPETFAAMSKTRGGNAFTLFGSRDADKIMAEDWPYLATPLAYDLSLELSPRGSSVAEGYGFPTTSGKAELTASTVFLSKRRGALLVRFSSEDFSNFGVTGTLSYTTPAGEPVSETASVSYDGTPLSERGTYFQQPSVGKTVALALLFSGMREAAERYGESQRDAAALMAKVTERVKADAEMLGADLADEVNLARDLSALMEAGAKQGTFYGNGALRSLAIRHQRE